MEEMKQLILRPIKWNSTSWNHHKHHLLPFFLRHFSIPTAQTATWHCPGNVVLHAENGNMCDTSKNYWWQKRLPSDMFRNMPLLDHVTSPFQSAARNLGVVISLDPSPDKHNIMRMRIRRHATHQLYAPEFHECGNQTLALSMPRLQLSNFWVSYIRSVSVFSVGP